MVHHNDNDNDIICLLALLRSRGKKIAATAIDHDFYDLTINGKSYGCWTSIGLLSVLAQYVNLTYPKQWFLIRSIPSEI